jgi:glucosylglycerate phosphorylase
MLVNVPRLVTASHTEAPDPLVLEQRVAFGGGDNESDGAMNLRKTVEFWRRPLAGDMRLYLKEPDYTRPLLQMSGEQKQRILDKLVLLYGEERSRPCFSEVERLMQAHYARKTVDMIAYERTFNPADRFTERDVIAITYADTIHNPEATRLQTLYHVLSLFLRRTINTVHILPFFPSSSDRGFSIIDFSQIDPQVGTWDDIERLSLRFRLMFDGVFNHVSSKSRWFQEFLDGNPEYQDFFVKFSTKQAIDPDHLSLILRPRTTDLLTGFQSLRGPTYVWTTFSSDQIDLNFKNPEVLLQVLKVLLFYIRRGADIIRLDAVTYLWREIGTTCAHLQQTHTLVKLFRAVLDVVAPQVALVTETNVPHKDNISYLGDGSDEAQMVYNFALPPLVLHSFQTGNCTELGRWAATLSKVADTATFLNFLDSHDGIGLLGAKDILTPQQIEAMIDRVRQHGGLISYRTASDGSPSPYEMNVTWYSALNPDDGTEDLELQVDRFVASRSIALVLAGVPGIYLPSLVGSRNDQEAIAKGEEARSINRPRVHEEALLELLSDPASTAYKIARRFDYLIEKRIECRAFHPNSRQRVFSINPSVFAVLRQAESDHLRVFCLTNVTGSSQVFTLPIEDSDLDGNRWIDLLSDFAISPAEGKLHITLAPYQVMWLRAR